MLDYIALLMLIRDKVITPPLFRSYTAKRYTLNSIQPTLNSEYCTVYGLSVYCTVYSIQCKVCYCAHGYISPINQHHEALLHLL